MIIADLEAIKRRCEAATPGPWDDLWFGTANYGCRADVPWPRRPPSGLWRRGISVAAEDDVSVSYTTSAPFTDPDAEFIAHSREDLPALLEAVERLLSMLTDAQTEAEMQAAEVERLRPLDAIVRQTAALTCWEYDSYDGTYQCRFCSKWTEMASPITDPPQMVDDTHDAGCLYALALAYVEANPA